MKTSIYIYIYIYMYIYMYIYIGIFLINCPFVRLQILYRTLILAPQYLKVQKL